MFKSDSALITYILIERFSAFFNSFLKYIKNNLKHLIQNMIRHLIQTPLSTRI